MRKPCVVGTPLRGGSCAGMRGVLRLRETLAAPMSRFAQDDRFMRDHEYFVYIVCSRSGTLYIGMTNSICRRALQHKRGEIEDFSSKYHCNPAGLLRKLRRCLQGHWPREATEGMEPGEEDRTDRIEERPLGRHGGEMGSRDAICRGGYSKAFLSRELALRRRITSCHPERVIKLLYLIVLIADNVAIFGCVGTVQPNCANFSQFRLLQFPWARGTGSAKLRVRPHRILSTFCRPSERRTPRSKTTDDLTNGFSKL